MRTYSTKATVGKPRIKKDRQYSVKPVGIKDSLAAASRRLRSPFATMSTLGILPLWLNSGLEAMKIRTLNQLARLQNVVVQAGNNYYVTMCKNIPKDSCSTPPQLYPL